MSQAMRRFATAAALLGALVPAMAATGNPPAGETVSYSKLAAGTAVLNGGLVLYEDKFPAEIVWGADGKVYFKNIISVFPEECYVEGTLEGSVITVPTGQLMEYNEMYDEGIAFGVFKTEIRVEDGKEFVDFEYVPDIESVNFSLASDGTITMQLPGRQFDGKTPSEYVAGSYYTDDFSFAGYGDFMQEYTRLELELVTMPEDAEVLQYVFVDQFSYAQIVDVAFHEGYLYIRGLSSMLPEGTIRARIEGDKALVPQNEYLGIYYDQYYIFTKVVYANPDYDEEDPDSPPFLMAPDDVCFELHIDADRRRIYADREGFYLSYHCDADDFLNSLGYFDVFELKYQESFAGTPANPVDLEYHTEWMTAQGFNDFFFTISNYSTEGTLLDTEKLYYKVFVNGTPVVFYQHMGTDLLGKESLIYPDVPVKVELLPYLFNNNEDIFKWSDNAFDIGIYTDDVKTIGVQSVYYFEETFTSSDIVTLDVETGEVTTTDGIATAVADSEIVAREYYSLDGRRVAVPGRGLYIEIGHTADGRKSVRKVAF